MARKSDEFADAPKAEYATVGIIKKRREATACGEGAAEMGLCTPVGKVKANGKHSQKTSRKK